MPWTGQLCVQDAIVPVIWRRQFGRIFLNWRPSGTLKSILYLFLLALPAIEMNGRGGSIKLPGKSSKVLREYRGITIGKKLLYAVWNRAFRTARLDKEFVKNDY